MENLNGNADDETSMPDNHEQMVSFLIEELKENWAYIRHIEEIRLKHTHIFLIITGSIISIFSFTMKFQDDNLIGQSFLVLTKIIIAQYGWAILAGSGFIFLYGFFLGRFLALQKRGYEHYRIVNANIRNWFTKKYNVKEQFGFETEQSPIRTTREVIASTFFYWYLLVVLINVFAFMVLSIAFWDLIAPWPLECNVILSVFLSVCVLIIQCNEFIKLNKNIKIGPG